MAKRFGGFTPQQQQTLLSKMGYTGPAQQDDINKFMMSSPKAASMMGRYAQMAKARVQGGPQTAMQVGGYMAPPTPMQQMQQQAATLDYNRLYAQPNQQPMQQPVAMQVGGMTTGAYNSFDEMMKYKQPNATMPELQQPMYGSSQPNTTGGFAMGVGQQGGTSQQQGGQFNSMEELMEYQKKNPGANLMGEYQRLQQQAAGQQGTTNTTDLPPPYDPSQGLPEAVGTLYTDPDSAMDAAFETDFNAGTEGTNQRLGGDKTWAKANVTNIANVENPKDYTLRKDNKGYWTLVYPDSPIPINTGHKNKSYATGRGNILAAAADANRNVVTEEEKTAREQQYDQQLEQYKSYYGQQATVTPEQTRANLDTAQSNLSKEQNLLQSYSNQLANMAADDPQRDTIQGFIDEQKVKVTNARANLSQAQTNLERVGMPSTTEMRADILDDPMSMVTKADVVTVSEEQRQRGLMDEGVGQAAAEAEQATATEAAIASDVPLAKEFEAAGMTTKEAAAEVANVMSKLTAVTGKPSAEALAEAATMDPSQLAQLGLTAEQIDRAQRVEQVAPLEVTPEMRVGAAVDFERAKAETNFTAATGVPSTEATVQGQLTNLLEQFEGGETPAWAAGAMRAATATLAARGLGASSMAGQAIVQAAMESALPIAQMDAQTRAQFEAQNLSNRQQAAMFAAEQRAKFLGMEFDQEFQARVQNAARIADVAQINFTAEQQVALENARMAQTVDIANLDAKNAKIMADAAAMSQLDLANLTNTQQANVQRAKAFLDFDMSSMTNQQQVAMFKAQSLASVYMSDTAAENAARQFNASSSDQVDMFFSNLQTQIQQFNNEQTNAINKFNAGEANAISQFNTAQQNARDQFNANNALVVEQANAQWEQAITTMDNAAQNQANRDAAQQANNMTEITYNNMLQQERDAMDYAWRSAENALQRENALMQVQMQNDAAAANTKGEAAGTIAAIGTKYVLNKILGPLG
jgi:hypothetical protein